MKNSKVKSPLNAAMVFSVAAILAAIGAALFFLVLNYLPIKKGLVHWDTLPLGELSTTGAMYLYYPDSSELSMFDDQGKKVLKILFNKAPDIYNGAGFAGDFGIPPDSELVILWRREGDMGQTLIHLLDHSPPSPSGKTTEYWLFQTQDPMETWTTSKIPLTAFDRNSYQSEGAPDDGKIDTKGKIEIQFSYPGTSEVTIYIKEIYFFWEAPSRWFLIAMFLIWLLPLGLNLYQVVNLSPLLFDAVKQRDFWLNLAASTGLFIHCLYFCFINSLEKLPAHHFVIIVPLITGALIFFRTRFPLKIQGLHFLIPAVIIWAFPYPWDFTSLTLLFVSAYLPVINRNLFERLVPIVLFLVMLIIKPPGHDVLDYLPFGYLLVLPAIPSIIRFIRDDQIDYLEHKRALALYHGILNNTNEAMLVTSTELAILGYNQGFLAWIRFVGVLKDGVSLYNILPEIIPVSWFKLTDPEKKILEHKVVLIEGSTTDHYLIRRYLIEDKGDAYGYLWMITKVTSLELLKEELRQANDELHRLSVSDSLTGLYNRRQFDESLQKEWWRCRRQKRYLTLVIADIDFFKQYNDHFGHQAGDECLKRVARIWEQGAQRSMDLAARIGGEEFAFILPETDAQGVLEDLKRVQNFLAKEAIEHPKSSVSKAVTLSMGFVTLVPHKELSTDDIFRAADEALYQAKKGGRNRIVQSMVDAKIMFENP
ncbi:MAG: diguanylate cyclase [Spirochaetales bacterium]|nr:diguanylate cyclase [Spirochaetales bacterium]